MKVLSAIGSAIVATIKWFSAWCGRSWRRGKGGKWAVIIVLGLLFACPCSLISRLGGGRETPVPEVAEVSRSTGIDIAEPTAPATHTIPVAAADNTPIPSATMTGAPSVTPTTEPSGTPKPTQTMARATATPAPTRADTNTPVPTKEATATPRPSPTETKIVYAMGAVQDVTIRDNTVLSPGQEFVKTWKVTNTGNAAWPSGAVLRHVSKDSLPKVEEIPVPSAKPGEISELSVEMVAPSSPGIYKSSWALCSGSKVLSSEIYVLIQVSAPVPTAAAARSGGTVYITASGDKYHTAYCRYAKNATAISCSDAIARGYQPCKVCRPSCR